MDLNNETFLKSFFETHPYVRDIPKEHFCDIPSIFCGLEKREQKLQNNGIDLSFYDNKPDAVARFSLAPFYAKEYKVTPEDAFNDIDLYIRQFFGKDKSSTDAYNSIKDIYNIKGDIPQDAFSWDYLKFFGKETFKAFGKAATLPVLKMTKVGYDLLGAEKFSEIISDDIKHYEEFYAMNPDLARQFEDKTGRLSQYSDPLRWATWGAEMLPFAFLAGAAGGAGATVGGKVGAILGKQIAPKLGTLAGGAAGSSAYMSAVSAGDVYNSVLEETKDTQKAQSAMLKTFRDEFLMFTAIHGLQYGLGGVAGNVKSKLYKTLLVGGGMPLEAEKLLRMGEISEDAFSEAMGKQLRDKSTFMPRILDMIDDPASRDVGVMALIFGVTHPLIGYLATNRYAPRSEQPKVERDIALSAEQRIAELKKNGKFSQKEAKELSLLENNADNPVQLAKEFVKLNEDNAIEFAENIKKEARHEHDIKRIVDTYQAEPVITRQDFKEKFLELSKMDKEDIGKLILDKDAKADTENLALLSRKELIDKYLEKYHTQDPWRSEKRMLEKSGKDIEKNAEFVGALEMAKENTTTLNIADSQKVLTHITKLLPKDAQGKMLDDIAKLAKVPANKKERIFLNAIDKLEKVWEQAEKNELIQSIKKEVTGWNKIEKQLPPDLQVLAKEFRDTFELAKPTEKTLIKMRDIMEKMEQDDLYLVPKPLLERIERLSKNPAPIRDLNYEDLKSIDTTLQSIFAANKQEKIELRRQKRVALVDEKLSVLDRTVEKTRTKMPPLDIHRKYFQTPSAITWYIDGCEEGPLTKAVVHRLRDADNRMALSNQRVITYYENFKKENKISVKGWDKRKVEYTSKTGEKFSLSEQDRMSLYLHSKSKDNLRHILDKEGGFVLSPEKATGELGERINISVDTLNKILSDINPKAQQLANEISFIYNHFLRNDINEVSMKLNGFEIAGIDNYFPIMVDRSFLDFDAYAKNATTLEMQKLTEDYLIESSGIFKERQKGATKPLILKGAEEVLDNSLKVVSKYYGYAEALKDVKTILGDSEIERAIVKAHGRKLFDAINDISASIERGKSTDEINKACSRILNKMTLGILKYDPFIAGMQSVSYLYARPHLGKYWLAGLKHKPARFSEMAQYSPMMWARGRGDISIETGEVTSKGVLKHKQELKMISRMDEVAIGYIWNAAKAQIKDMTNLSGKEFYKEVAKITEKVTHDTQPTFMAVDRPMLARSEGLVGKVIMRFSSQINKELSRNNLNDL